MNFVCDNMLYEYTGGRYYTSCVLADLLPKEEGC